jgi:hypothetical protein
MKTEKYLPTHQIGLTWKNDEGETCVTVAPHPHKNGKRVAWLSETTFVGQLDGMHYYAMIKVGHPWWSVNGDGGGHAGYGGKYKPEMEDIRLEAERRLTKVEKGMDGKRLGKIGEMTYRFNLPADARAAAIALFKKRFAPGWVLLPEYMEENQDEYPILAET